jgi:hypothetical protein
MAVFHPPVVVLLSELTPVTRTGRWVRPMAGGRWATQMAVGFTASQKAAYELQMPDKPMDAETGEEIDPF